MLSHLEPIVHGKGANELLVMFFCKQTTMLYSK